MALSRKEALAGLGLVAAGLASAAYWVAGTMLIGPAPEEVGPPPPGFERVRFGGATGARLAAWVGAGDGRGVVVLLHGVRSNRRVLAARATMLRRAGYSVVAVDLQAHGESDGERITYGHHERHDAIAAVGWARQRFPGEPVGVIGLSLGGAASLLAGPQLGADAVVAEAVFPDIVAATANRMRLYLGPLAPLGRGLTAALLRQFPLRTGIQMRDLRPVDAVAALGVPLLVIAGTEDRRTTPEDTRRLFAAARGEKELWWVEGAAHEDYHAFAPEAYEDRVLDFLERHLRA